MIEIQTRSHAEYQRLKQMMIWFDIDTRNVLDERNSNRRLRGCQPEDFVYILLPPPVKGTKAARNKPINKELNPFGVGKGLRLRGHRNTFVKIWLRNKPNFEVLRKGHRSTFVKTWMRNKAINMEEGGKSDEFDGSKFGESKVHDDEASAEEEDDV